MESRERELFDYRDGKLYWKVRKSNSRTCVGQEAGCLHKGVGYFVVKYDRKSRNLHRVIWAYHYGEIEEGVLIDHINRDPLDNRIENLRACNKAQNSANCKVNIRNKLGVKGVSMTRGGRFRSVIRKQGKLCYLGTFDTAEEANAAYVKAAKEHHGEFACGG